MPLFTSSNELSASESHLLRNTMLELAEKYSAADKIELLERMLGEDACRDMNLFRCPDSFLLSVVIPVFNEAATIERVIERVRGAELNCEIVIVDDGSTDGTVDVLNGLKDENDLTVVLHESNQGKGAAVRTGFAHVRGDAVVIQDADMEYDPRDFRLLVQPIIEDRADVVYGSRFSGGSNSDSPLWHQSGNQLITWLSNLSTGLKFTDVETCYKMFRREFIDRIAPTLHERGFGIELEMTAKLAKMKDVRFHEQPISYTKRSYAEGKKIGWRDGLWAMWCIVRY